MSVRWPCLDSGEPHRLLAARAARLDGSLVWTRREVAQRERLDGAGRRLSARARRLSPVCEDGGATDDLTTDHLPHAWASASAASGSLWLT